MNRDLKEKGLRHELVKHPSLLSYEPRPEREGIKTMVAPSGTSTETAMNRDLKEKGLRRVTGSRLLGRIFYEPRPEREGIKTRRASARDLMGKTMNRDLKEKGLRRRCRRQSDAAMNPMNRDLKEKGLRLDTRRWINALASYEPRFEREGIKTIALSNPSKTSL